MRKALVLSFLFTALDAHSFDLKNSLGFGTLGVGIDTENDRVDIKKYNKEHPGTEE